MTKLSLNIGERLVLSSIINTFGEGLSLSAMKTCMKILEKIDITEVEKKKVGFIATTERVKWDDMKYTADIEFSLDEFNLINEFVEKKDKEKKYKVNEGKIMIGLIDKIVGKDKKDE